VHPEEDEWFYVLEGEFVFYVDETRLSLPAGSFAFGPKGVPHTFIAGPDGGKALIGFQPFHFEGFLREVGEPATERVVPPPLETAPDMERLLPIAARNGMNILGPPGPPPGR
jgi:cupin domain